MSRLIDADALYNGAMKDEYFRFKEKDQSGREAFVYSCAMQRLVEAPTIEAEPVKRGKWINENNVLTCSQCGFRLIGAKPHYCQKCGAKMKMEDEISDAPEAAYIENITRYYSAGCEYGKKYAENKLIIYLAVGFIAGTIAGSLIGILGA